MSLKYVLLTLLERERKTGYEIVKTFENAVGYFWSANHQQVYRELSRLTESGVVKFTAIKQPDKPDKKVYRNTAAGKRDLQKWLNEPIKDLPSKDLVLVKLLNLREGNVAVILAELDRAILKAKERAAVYDDIEKLHYSTSQLNALKLDDLALYLALRKGITGIASHLSWLHETRDLITRRSNV